MKLLVVGLDRTVADAISASAKRQQIYYSGWDVDIVILATGTAVTSELAPGLRVHVSGGSNKIVALWRGCRLAKKIARHRMPEVVSSQDASWSGLVASCVAHHIHAKFHLQDHSGLFARRPFTMAEKVLCSYSKRLARRARRIRTVSQRGAQGLIRLGIPSERIDVIPIATDLSRFHSIPSADPSVLHVLCVARLEPEKGINVLLDAWKIVIASRPDARLRIVGDGSLRTSLEARAGMNVEFVGRQEDVVPHLAWSTVAVQPSYFEGWGLSVIEAAAAGRPVIMTDVGCAGEIIRDGESGRVVPVGDVEAFANAILDVADHPEKAKTFVENARKHVNKLRTPEKTVEAVRSSFERAAEFRLLVTAQAVDLDDPLFGFFVPWLSEASKRFGQISVLALRVGRHDLPANVTVIPLRPKGSRSRVAVIQTLWSYSWKARHQYDGVFLRGDALYAAIAGWLWRLLRKRVVLWYTHYRARSIWFWVAQPFLHEMVTAVPESNPRPCAVKIGHHIETERFFENRTDGRLVPRVLILGRVSLVKRVPWIVDVLRPFYEEAKINLRILGKATDAQSREQLRFNLPNGIQWEDRAVPYAEIPLIFADADIFINATPGSMDKTILEAASSGAIVLAATRGMRVGLPEDLHWLNFSDESELRQALERILALTQEERRTIGQRLREWVKREHGLENNVGNILALLQDRAPQPPFKQRLKRCLWRLRFRRPNGLRVFMFHSFDGTGSAGWDLLRFRAFLIRLRSAGHVMVHPEAGVFPPPNVGRSPVLLTFDDATTDLEPVIREMVRFHAPGIVFAPCGVDRLQASDGVTRTVLSEQDLIRMRNASGHLLSVGGHGVSHRSFVGMEEDLIKTELAASLDFVRRIQGKEKPLFFAYPRGKWDPAIARSVASAGFAAAFTVSPGACTSVSDPLALPRFPVLYWMDSRDVLRSAGL